MVDPIGMKPKETLDDITPRETMAFAVKIVAFLCVTGAATLLAVHILDASRNNKPSPQPIEIISMEAGQ